MPLQVVLLLLVVLTCCAGDELSCREQDAAFELWTGRVYTSPADMLDTRPGTLLLQDCIQMCRQNSTCLGLNFETGLCVMFSSNADKHPDSVTESEYPVYTMYLQKVCLGTVLAACSRPWAYERVQGYRLGKYIRRRLRIGSREACLQMCLHEHDFICRSASFSEISSECVLSEVDRFTVKIGEKLVKDPQYDYYESNCVDDPVSMCEFEPQTGKILKTVDAVFQDIVDRKSCERLCLNAEFRCHTYDYGDTGERVCRLSHHGEPSLSHVREPYLLVPGASSWQRQSCYNVTLQCDGHQMMATIRTSRIFNGKVYARNSPNSCVLDVQGQMAVTFPMGYQDLSCDVRQEAPGVFTSDIIIQHHDQIVTSSDVGLSLRCVYALGNQTVSHSAGLSVDGRLGSMSHQLSVVQSPNISMSITDRQGVDILTAQVGDALALRFTIDDVNSPYEILVRELVAQDGRDSAEIVLIDEQGCPTDPSIMGAVSRVQGSAQLLTVPFDAFKFPSSGVVQFKALVTPCLPSCRPVSCQLNSFQGVRRRVLSYGRRRRRRQLQQAEDDVLVVQRIHIDDTFQFQQPQQDSDAPETDWSPSSSMSVSLTGVAISCGCFLLLQLLAVAVWMKVRSRNAPEQKVQYYTNSSH